MLLLGAPLPRPHTPLRFAPTLMLELPPLPQLDAAVLPALPAGLTDSSGLQRNLADLTVISNELSDLFDSLLLQVQITGNLALAGAAVLAILSGLVFQDRSSPTKVFNELQDANTFRTDLSAAATEAWDRGETDLVSIGTSRNSRFAKAQEADEKGARSSLFSEASRNLARPVSVGLWLELFLCVLLDAAGNASLYVPNGYGELFDVINALGSAFIINLFFDWPALAAFAFWEELLPFTDVVPSATIGWTLILLGVRPWLRARRGLPPRDARAPPPVADMRSYTRAEEWMQSGRKPWED